MTAEAGPQGASQELLLKIANLTLQTRSLQHSEMLTVPVLDFDMTQSFDELTGRPLLTPGGSLPGFGFVLQRVQFRLTREGAKLESEAAGGLFGGMSRDLSFNRPFLVMLCRSDAPRPYFAAWIGGTEMLKAVPVASTRPRN